MKNIKITVLFVLFSMQIIAQVPTTGLVGYWPFNGNASDLSTYGNNGTVSGATLTTDRFNTNGSAYLFNGTSSFISVADHPVLRLANTNYTIGVWVNQSSLLSIQEGILSKRTNLSQTGYLLNIQGPTQSNPGFVNYQVSGGNDPRAYSDTSIALGAWYHLCVRYTFSSETLEIFINGVPSSTTTNIPGPNSAAASALIFGNDAAGNSYFFNGKIDDVVMYNRALTTAEVYQLYSNCSTIDVSTGKLAQYNFTGNANDNTGNGNNGVVSGATLTTDRFGNTANAYQFNGTTDFITVADNASLRLSNTDFTISTWINESNVLSGQESVISKRGTGNQNGYIMHMTGTLAPTIGKVSFVVSGGSDPKSVSVSSVSFNSWHHVGVVYDYSDQVMLTYIDGELDQVTPGITSPNAATAVDMIIGNDASGSPYFFHGKIDDIIIFNRALSTCDMDSLFHMPDPSTTGLGDDLNSPSINFYPNPADDYFTIQSVSGNMIKIYDVTGRVIEQFEIQNKTTTLNCSDWTSGVYIIQLTDAKGSIGMKKFVKN